MRPLSPAFRAEVPVHPEEDLEATVSYSDSEDEASDPPVLQKLALALIAWQPTLVAAYARLDQATPELAPFAAFLARLDKEVGRHTAMRGEIIGWLQALAIDDRARRHAFGIAAGSNGAGTALASYLAIRTASQ